jgi:hypothetical protein
MECSEDWGERRPKFDVAAIFPLGILKKREKEKGYITVKQSVAIQELRQS